MAANTMNQHSIAQAATPTTAATFSTGNTSAVPLTTTTNAVDPPQTPIIDDDFWNQPPLGTYGVISSYTQTLDDELYIQPGDRIQVYTEYDDGWCLGINLTRGGARGVLPQHCLDKDALFATSTSAVLS
ncbi:MAG: hypothetical protein EXX96DRAFT_559768 [Benjaminiella poitrasii]|nr:MAG: hypothetical protein EXX96DRAFT_559768 [Benjaminiella poitrasii]